MSLLSRCTRGQYPLLQSASTAILLLASSSSSLLFTPTPPTIAHRSLTGIGITRPSNNNVLASGFDTSRSRIQSSFYSNTAIKSLASDIDCKQQIMDNEKGSLLLPYVDGSHRSAKIIVPPIDEEQVTISSSSDRNTIANYDSMTIHEFKERLEATIISCKQLGKSALWVEVPMSQARYIEGMGDIPGLNLHHTKENTIHLCLWLNDNVENKIPEYATHQVGVGAMVVNSRDEILCVRELRNNYRPWKIPGGLADLGEQLEEAAIREVKEETGIDCEFQSVLGFRHTHGLQFGRSDLYFVCRLSPIEKKCDDTGITIIPEPTAQESEIAAAAWIPLQEYRDMVNGITTGEPHAMMQRMMSLHDIEENDIQRTVINSIVPGRKPSPLYHAS